MKGGTKLKEIIAENVKTETAAASLYDNNNEVKFNLGPHEHS